ncbi:MAG: hypothetical protein HQK63_06560 [Desulfamplus sp.]|nr:hypothetical protein [Desulfamplus sp.]
MSINKSVLVINKKIIRIATIIDKFLRDKNKLLSITAIFVVTIMCLTVNAGQTNIVLTSESPDTTTDYILKSRPTKPQLGVNFIRFYMDNLPIGDPNLTTSYLQPEWIFSDFKNMGIHTYRQFVKADLLWDIIEPEDDQWHFDEADAVIPNLDFEPIVTLFAMQYASGTPPWETDSADFQKTLGDEAKEYLEKVIERYGRYVRYWELGNEMDHWRAYDPDQPPVTVPYPNLVVPPSGGFSPREQGLFLSQAAAFIKERDPDAVIVLPGMSGLNGYIINEWLKGVIEGGNGSDWFDVINYHYYPEWQSYINARVSLETFIDENNLENKAVWLTETGSTASETLTIRTDYPNSYESQAADIFRRIIPAYAMGDDLVMWHTYIDSIDSPTNNWRLYGVRSDQGVAHLSYYALQLFTKELLPFDKVETISSNPKGINAYKITTDAGAVRYVVWGEGDYQIPNGITQITSVIPNSNGAYIWENIQSNSISLTTEPFLLKPGQEEDINNPDDALCKSLSTSEVIIPQTPDDFDNIPVKVSSGSNTPVFPFFVKNSFMNMEITFPCYTQPVDTYIAVVFPDGTPYFLSKDGKLTLEFEPLSTNTTEAKNMSVKFTSLHKGDYVIYWASVPTNGGDIFSVNWGGYSELGYWIHSIK